MAPVLDMLQAQKDHLEALRVEVRSLRDTVEVFLQSVSRQKPALAADAPSYALGSLNISPITPWSTPRQRVDFPAIRFWTKAEWRASLALSKGDGITNTNTDGKKDGKYKKLTFLEHENGTPYTESETSGLTAAIKGVFLQIDQSDEAAPPPKWDGNALMSHRVLLRKALYSDFPDLEYCETHWKVHQLAIETYSNHRASHPWPERWAGCAPPKAKRKPKAEEDQENVLNSESIPAATATDPQYDLTPTSSSVAYVDKRPSDIVESARPQKKHRKEGPSFTLVNPILVRAAVTTQNTPDPICNAMPNGGLPSPLASTSTTSVGPTREGANVVSSFAPNSLLTPTEARTDDTSHVEPMLPNPQQEPGLQELDRDSLPGEPAVTTLDSDPTKATDLAMSKKFTQKTYTRFVWDQAHPTGTSEEFDGYWKSLGVAEKKRFGSEAQKKNRQQMKQ
ncbi:hypothetical protein PHLGIDRAFT_119413 [Phlebiopsis gigantea 11061_1 CR5-6]|uniref:Uncharacterized protein n=1 Tax=Phlebiopsis gigantea (strain 11061_1 CR5-6) TaxID=745531 RepID=A0A0C3RWI1_PHLG1|nr:hypothetical protein PHLGIDRAFT_119413 [Phlebiopsis gigantea 11061_1 CR5-6]